MSLLIQAASYVGDYAPGKVVRLKFNSTDAAGTLSAISSPTVKVYKDNSTVESAVGVTLTSGFDGLTGLYLVEIDTSADGSFYSQGSEFEVVLTAGSVGVISVVGTTVGHFSLANRVATLADGVAHGGASAKLRLGSSDNTIPFHVTCSGSAAAASFEAATTGPNVGAVQIVNAGDYSALRLQAGAYGAAVRAYGAFGLDLYGTLSPSQSGGFGIAVGGDTRGADVYGAAGEALKLFSDSVSAILSGSGNPAVYGFDGTLSPSAFDNMPSSTGGSGVTEYTARVIWAVDEGADNADRILVVWHKDQMPVDGGDVTTPTIKVTKVSDGSTLVAESAMTRVGSTAAFLHSEAANRITGRAAFLGEFKATIDGTPRVWYELLDR